MGMEIDAAEGTRTPSGKGLHTPQETCQNNGRAPGRGQCAPDVEAGRFLSWQRQEFKK